MRSPRLPPGIIISDGSILGAFRISYTRALGCQSLRKLIRMAGLPTVPKPSDSVAKCAVRCSTPAERNDRMVQQAGSKLAGSK